MVAGKWAESDPAAAVAWAGTVSGPGSRILSGALAVWAQSDPAAAAGYVGTIPQPEVRDEAFKSVVSSWAFSDAGAAADWLHRLPHSASKDLAAEQLCEALAPSQPERAFVLAAEIADAETRQERMTAIAGDWLKADSVTAGSAVARSSLDAGVKTRLLGPGFP